MELFGFIRENARWLAVGVLLTFISSFGQTYFISIFAGDIRQIFDLSHGDWGGIYFLGTMASGLTMIWAGGLADHFRVRVLALAMICTLTLVCFAMAGNSTVWLLPFVIFGLRFSGQSMISHIAVVAMARWYVRARGKAIAIASLGFSFGEAFLPYLFVSLLGVMHWRSLWIVAGLAALATTPLLLWLLQKERVPSDISADSDSYGMDEKHWVRSEVIRDWRFWGLIPMATASGIFGTALFFQQVHMAEVKGWSHAQFVALFPIYTVTSIGSGLLYGLAIDRWGSPRLMALYPIPMALAFLTFYAADSLAMAGVAFALMGLTQGGGSTVNVAFWPEVYGTRNIGSIKSLATALMVIGSAIGPAFSGYFIDIGVDFPDQMIAISVYVLVICALTYWVVSFMRPHLPKISAAA